MPVSKKTGAKASWMACAMPERSALEAFMFFSWRFAVLAARHHDVVVARERKISLHRTASEWSAVEPEQFDLLVCGRVQAQERAQGVDVTSRIRRADAQAGDVVPPEAQLTQKMRVVLNVDRPIDELQRAFVAIAAIALVGRLE